MSFLKVEHSGAVVLRKGNQL